MSKIKDSGRFGANSDFDDLFSSISPPKNVFPVPCCAEYIENNNKKKLQKKLMLNWIFVS